MQPVSVPSGFSRRGCSSFFCSNIFPSFATDTHKQVTQGSLNVAKNSFLHLPSTYDHNALCCYPNINSAIRNLGLNTPTAPIFLQFNYFRENIWVIIWVQFHFLYIFVGRVDRIHKTSHTRMLSFYFFASDLQCFGDELNVSSKTAPANI